jgi:hypothetical protein
MAIPKLAMIPSGYKDGKVYSVLPSNGDGDFTFSRGSNATRVNKDGLIETMPLETSDTELVTNGSFAGVSNGTDVITLPQWSAYGSPTNRDIQSEALRITTTSFNQGALLTIPTTIGNTYLFKFTPSGNPPRIVIDAVGGFSTSTIYFKAVGTSTLIYFQSNGNTAGETIYDNISVKEVISGLDTPRLDYTDSSCPSLLLEPQRTNLIPYSQAKFNTIVKSGTYVDNFAISPDGTQNATKLTATNTDPYFYQNLSLSAASYTASIYLKGIGNSIGKNFEIRLANNIYTDVIPSEWTRFEYTETMPSGTATVGLEIPQPAVIGDEVLIWGWQAEEGSYATSYIPTNGAVATRLADVCNSAGTSDTFNDSEGVLMAEISALDNDLTNRQTCINDNSTSDRVMINLHETSNQIQGYITSGNNEQADMRYVVADTTLSNKVAVKYKLNDCALWVNGFEVATDTSATMPVGLQKYDFDNSGGGLPFYGNTKQIQYFDTALTDIELEELTSWESFILMANGQNYTIK